MVLPGIQSDNIYLLHSYLFATIICNLPVEYSNSYISFVVDIIMSINKTRGFLYWLARILGDWQAISSGSSKKVVKRIGRRTAGEPQENRRKNNRKDVEEVD